MSEKMQDIMQQAITELPSEYDDNNTISNETIPESSIINRKRDRSEAESTDVSPPDTTVDIATLPVTKKMRLSDDPSNPTQTQPQQSLVTTETQSQPSQPQQSITPIIESNPTQTEEPEEKKTMALTDIPDTVTTSSDTTAATTTAVPIATIQQTQPITVESNVSSNPPPEIPPDSPTIHTIPIIPHASSQTIDTEETTTAAAAVAAPISEEIIPTIPTNDEQTVETTELQSTQNTGLTTYPEEQHPQHEHEQYPHQQHQQPSREELEAIESQPMGTEDERMNGKYLGRSAGEIRKYLRSLDHSALTSVAMGVIDSDRRVMDEVRSRMHTHQILCKVFIRSLSYETTDDTIKNVFKDFGEVKEAVIVKDRFTGGSRGFGFVTYASAADSSRALEEYLKNIDDREVVCNLASKPQGKRTNTRYSSFRGGRGGGSGGGDRGTSMRGGRGGHFSNYRGRGRGGGGRRGASHHYNYDDHYRGGYGGYDYSGYGAARGNTGVTGTDSAYDKRGAATGVSGAQHPPPPVPYQPPIDQRQSASYYPYY